MSPITRNYPFIIIDSGSLQSTRFSGEFLIMSLTGLTSMTDLTHHSNGSGNILTSSCDTRNLPWIFSSSLFPWLDWQKISVVWLLGFHMHRNALSVCIFNLAGASFFFLCSKTSFSLQNIYYHTHTIYIIIPNSLRILFTFSYLACLSLLAVTIAKCCLPVMWPIWNVWGR